MNLGESAPYDHVCDHIGEVNRARRRIEGQVPGAIGLRVKAEVALSEMFGYIGSLRTMTSGRGQFSMEFSHYSQCPRSVSDAVVEAEKERQEAKSKN